MKVYIKKFLFKMFVIIQTQSTSGVFRVTALGREICQFSNPLVATRTLVHEMKTKSGNRSLLVIKRIASGLVNSLIPRGLSIQWLLSPAAGNRNYNSAGTWNNRGTNGNYWSSTVSGTSARNFNFNSGSSNMAANNRGNGLSVRCLQDLTGCVWILRNGEIN
jgi:hypothetical protein